MQNNDTYIRQIVQQELHKTAQSNRFNVQNQGRHIHNDLDAPYVFQPILTYVGQIGSDGTVGLLPNGWTASWNGSSTGAYSIFHNLNSRLYGVVASATQSTNTPALPVINPFENQFDIDFFSVVPSHQDTSFSFILTIINNKTTKIPTYYGSIIP